MISGFSFVILELALVCLDAQLQSAQVSPLMATAWLSQEGFKLSDADLDRLLQQESSMAPLNIEQLYHQQLIMNQQAQRQQQLAQLQRMQLLQLLQNSRQIQQAPESPITKDQLVESIVSMSPEQLQWYLDDQNHQAQQLQQFYAIQQGLQPSPNQLHPSNPIPENQAAEGLNPFEPITGDTSLFPGLSPNSLSGQPFMGHGLNIPLLGTGENVKGGFLFGYPSQRPTVPEEAFAPVKTESGVDLLLPKGVFSSSNKDVIADAGLDLPDFTNPLSFLKTLIGGDQNTGEKESSISGIHVPLPFGMQPISVQLRKEKLDNVREQLGLGQSGLGQAKSNPLLDAVLAEVGVGSGQDAAPTPSLTETLLSMSEKDPNQLFRSVSSNLENSNFERRLAANLLGVLAPVFQQEPEPVKFGEVGGTGTKQENVDSTGVYVEFPGLKPFYVGGFLDKEKQNSTNIG